MPEATIVLYDVSQAIKKLVQLENQVDRTGKKTKKSFEKGGKSIDVFDNNLTRATRNFIRGFSPAIGNAIRPTDNFLSGIIRLTAELGPLGPAVLGVAGAVGVAVLAFVDLNEVSRNTFGEIEGRITSLRDSLEVTDLLSNIFDQKELRALEDRTREIERIQAGLNIKQALAKQDRLAAQQRLDTNLATLRKIEDNEKTSAKAIQRIKDKALLGTGATGPILNAQITEVLDKAAKAGRGGDLERAAQLLQGARQLAKDAKTDRPDFFTDRIRQQEKAILASAKRQETGKDSVLKKQVEEENEALKKQIVLLTRREAIVEPELKLISAEKQGIATTRKDIEDTKAVDQLERARVVTIEAINTALDKQKTTFEKIKILAAASVSVAFPGLGVGAEVVISQARGVSKLRKELEAARDSASLGTSKGDIRAGRQLEDTSRLFEEIDRLRDKNVFSRAFNQDVKILRLVKAELKEVLRLRGELIKRGADSPTSISAEQLQDSTIKEAERSATLQPDINRRELLARLNELIAEDQNKAADAAERQSNAIRRSADSSRILQENLQRSILPTPATQLNQAPASTEAAAAVGPRQINQTVTVNANIKGGLFDADTIKTFTEIARQEIRKLTAEAIA